MVGIAVFENLSLRRKCERQTTRNNVPASSLDVHFKRSNLTPVLDCMLQEFNSPLTTFVPQPFLALNIIPNNVQKSFTLFTIVLTLTLNHQISYLSKKQFYEKPFGVNTERNLIQL